MGRLRSARARPVSSAPRRRRWALGFQIMDRAFRAAPAWPRRPGGPVGPLRGRGGGGIVPPTPDRLDGGHGLGYTPHTAVFTSDTAGFPHRSPRGIRRSRAVAPRLPASAGPPSGTGPEAVRGGRNHRLLGRSRGLPGSRGVNGRPRLTVSPPFDRMPSTHRPAPPDTPEPLCIAGEAPVPVGFPAHRSAAPSVWCPRPGRHAGRRLRLPAVRGRPAGSPARDPRAGGAPIRPAVYNSPTTDRYTVLPREPRPWVRTTGTEADGARSNGS